MRHPIDCPICDKAGECLLQDYHFLHGRSQRRADLKPFTSRRRPVGDTVTSVCRSLRDVQSLCAFHAGSHRHPRIDGGQSRCARGNRRLSRATAGATSCRATSSICVRSVRWAMWISSTPNASGSCAVTNMSAPAARRVVRSMSTRTRIASIDSSLARIRTSTAGGSAMKAATASLTCTVRNACVQLRRREGDDYRNREWSELPQELDRQTAAGRSSRRGDLAASDRRRDLLAVPVSARPG